MSVPTMISMSMELGPFSVLPQFHQHYFSTRVTTLCLQANCFRKSEGSGTLERVLSSEVAVKKLFSYPKCTSSVAKLLEGISSAPISGWMSLL